ncbi:MAG: hypothetical protein KY468_19840 [Armatimonadetes bacterium]|nr:hypothetical protein [Armatimonadota bacterium]
MFMERKQPFLESLAYPSKKEDYNDEEVMIRYVWEYCTHAMTDFEMQVNFCIHIRAKAEINENPNFAEKILEWKGLLRNAYIEEALKNGPKRFRQRVKDRLLRECPDQIFINRCPSCGRIVRTPKARLCLWCGYAWHHLVHPSEE